MKNKHFFKAFYSFAPALITAVIVVGAAFASTANASTIPTLTLSVSSPGYTLLTVNGDANYPVTLYYYLQSTGGSESVTSGELGLTNSNGYFTTTLNDASYNIPYGSLVYVNVDGQNSATVAWPNYYSNGGGPTINNAGGLVLSQSNITLQVGQTVAVTTNYTYSNSYYQALTIVSNSNSASVSAIVSGNQIDITGANYGAATLVVCQTGTNTCGTIYVNVPSPTTVIGPLPTPVIYVQPVSFGVGSLSLNAGTSQEVQIYGSGNFSIVQNSNPAVANVSLNGSWLYVQGIQAGTSNVIVCQNYQTNSCATLPIDVIATQTSWYGNIYGYSSYSSYWPTYNYEPTYYPTTAWTW